MADASRKDDSQCHGSVERLFQTFFTQRFVKLRQLCLLYEDTTQDEAQPSRDILNFITTYTKDRPAMGIRQQRPEKDILNEKFRRYLGI